MKFLLLALIPVTLIMFVTGAVVAGFLLADPGAERRVPVSEAAAENFDRKVSAVQSRASSPVPPGVSRLVLTEEELTSKLALALDQESGAPPVEDLEVRLEDGTIEASGRIGLGLARPRLVVRTRVAVEQGQLSGEVERLTVGGVDVPAPATARVLAALFGAAGVTVPANVDLTDLSSLQVPAGLRTLEITPGQLLIEVAD